jgi:hypothetical protein
MSAAETARVEILAQPGQGMAAGDRTISQIEQEEYEYVIFCVKVLMSRLLMCELQI